MPNTHSDRLGVWDEATRVVDSMRQENILYMEYFNAPLYPLKKMGGLEDSSNTMQ